MPDWLVISLIILASLAAGSKRLTQYGFVNGKHYREKPR